MTFDPQNLKYIIDNHEPNIIGTTNTKKTSILIPLLKPPERETDPNYRMVFERRADHLEVQPGDVCFPGGTIEEKDSTPRETAIRETSEELDLKTEQITLWGQFDTMVVPWELTIHTYVGKIRPDGPLTTTSPEVAELFTVSIEAAFEQQPDRYTIPFEPSPGEDFPYEKIPRGKNYDWSPRQLPELFYEFHGRVVWGLTARILHRFLEVVGGDSRGRKGNQEG